MNNIIRGFLLIFVVLYGSFARQPLNNKIYSIINNKIFYILMLILIAYVGTHDIVASFFISLLFAFIMYQINETKIQEYFLSKIYENFITN